jgi:ketosteroid isomerase-like protein
MKIFVLLISIQLAIAGFLIAEETSTDFNAAVRTTAKEFSAALAAGDMTRIGSLYSEDAIAFPPNVDMVKGREAIQSFWKTLSDVGAKADLEIVETESDGNLGVEIGKFVITAKDGKVMDQGKYVVVWKKENGSWKLYRDIWNSSVPSAAAH